METIKTLGGGARRCFFCVALAGSFAAAAVTRMDYPDANTVLLDDITRVEYAADGTFVIENDERILALTDKGRRSLRSTTLTVSRRYGTAEIVEVEIIGTFVVFPVQMRKPLVVFFCVVLKRPMYLMKTMRSLTRRAI